MKSIYLSLAAAATIGLAITAAPIADAAARDSGAPAARATAAPDVQAPARRVVPPTQNVRPRIAVQLSPKRATRRVNSLAQLPGKFRARILMGTRQAVGQKLAATPGPVPTAITETELDLICAKDWFYTYDEDKNGDPAAGTINLHCDGDEIPAA